MRKILSTIAFSLVLLASARAQHTYISSSGVVYTQALSTVRYASPDIYVEGRYDNERSTWTAFCEIRAQGATTGPQATEATFQYEYTDAVINALTLTGSNNVDKIKNGLLQAVKNTLTGLNGAIFTLN